MLKTLFNKLLEMKILILLLTFSLTNYSVTKTNIEKERSLLKTEYLSNENKANTLNEARIKLTKCLYNDIFNHWYTTKWSFEGHTETPKQGTIACGYFVSTTLRDVGFNLNRYKLAQRKPEDETKSIACGTAIDKLQNINKQELKKYFLKQKDGIYFIGLDFHVGIFIKTIKKSILFIPITLIIKA